MMSKTPAIEAPAGIAAAEHLKTVFSKHHDKDKEDMVLILNVIAETMHTLGVIQDYTVYSEGSEYIDVAIKAHEPAHPDEARFVYIPIKMRETND